MTGSLIPNILVVDDDRDIVAAISKLLEIEGFHAVRAYDGLEALGLSFIQSYPSDPDRCHDAPSGRAVCHDTDPAVEKHPDHRTVRENRKTATRFSVCRWGADDYITKPYNPHELIARIRSNLRRYMHLGDISSISGEGIIQNGGLSLDTISKQLFVDNEPVRLTATELKIVELLMHHAGRVFSAEEIYRLVWNEEAYAVENTVMVHIRRIREKIEINPKEPRYLKVVWGIGYKIEKSR